MQTEKKLEMAELGLPIEVSDMMLRSFDMYDAGPERSVGRCTGGLVGKKLLARILSGDVTTLVDSVDFARDGVFCENVYWLDFENKTFTTSSYWTAFPKKVCWRFDEMHNLPGAFYIKVASAWCREYVDHLCRFAQSEYRQLSADETTMLARIALVGHILRHSYEIVDGYRPVEGSSSDGEQGTDEDRRAGEEDRAGENEVDVEQSGTKGESSASTGFGANEESKQPADTDGPKSDDPPEGLVEGATGTIDDPESMSETSSQGTVMPDKPKTTRVDRHYRPKSMNELRTLLSQLPIEPTGLGGNRIELFRIMYIPP